MKLLLKIHFQSCQEVRDGQRKLGLKTTKKTSYQKKKKRVPISWDRDGPIPSREPEITYSAQEKGIKWKRKNKEPNEPKGNER